MKRIYFDIETAKKGYNFVKEGLNAVKNEALYLASKKVSFIDNPYEAHKKVTNKQMMERNISFSSALRESSYNDRLE